MVALNDLSKLILFWSVDIKPLYTVIIVTITEISKAIIIIEFILAPAQIIIIGPNATLGKLFIIVKYGSNTLYKKLFHHNNIAINVPKIVPIPKLITVSYTVIHI